MSRAWFLHDIGRRCRAGVDEKKMHMVFDTADYDGLAIELLKYSTQIAMQFLPHDWVTQEGAAIFG